MYFIPVFSKAFINSPIDKLMKALGGAGIKYAFKQENKDSFGLELTCGVGDEPLTMLIQSAELFYYDNNNT